MARILAVLLFLVLAWAIYDWFRPPQIPGTLYTPEVAGPVETETPGIITVRGREIRITPDTPRRVLSDGVISGGIVLYGHHDGDEWMASFGETGERETCYLIVSNLAWDDGEHVIIAVSESEGLRLPKANDFQAAYPFPDTGQSTRRFSRWCLNDRGEVVSADSRISAD